MKIIFLGTSDFGIPALKRLVEAGFEVSLVVTQPDRLGGRKKQLLAPPLKEAALELGLDVYQPEDINSEESLERLGEVAADYLVVVSYGQILSQAILDLGKKGALNIHPSLLPKYRGAAPIERAIMAGEKETGVAVIEMTLALDAGNILLEEKVAIDDVVTGGELSNWLKEKGAELLIQVLENEDIKSYPQGEEGLCYAKKLNAADKYLTFEKSSKEVHNQVRGLVPRIYPAVLYEENLLGICETAYEEDYEGKEPVGTVLLIDKKKGILIKCQKGALWLKRVKPQGKKEMSFKDFLNGHQVVVGDILIPKGDEK